MKNTNECEIVRIIFFAQNPLRRNQKNIIRSIRSSLLIRIKNLPFLAAAIKENKQTTSIETLNKSISTGPKDKKLKGSILTKAVKIIG